MKEKSKSVNFDQFYTKNDVANQLISSLFSIFPTLKKEYRFIEPAAGAGSFLVALGKNKISKKRIKAYDIDPQDSTILKIDYLDLKIPYSNYNVIVGNPPFGKRGRMALEFLNKGLKESDIVAFILPNIFNRYSIQKKIDQEASLLLNISLQEDSFIFEEKSYAVKCCFQVWVKNNRLGNDYTNLRIQEEPPRTDPDLKTYIHNNTKATLKYFDKNKYGWDFAVVRQGYYDYSEKITNEKELKKNRQYFFVKFLSEEAKKVVDKIDFRELALKNTQVLGFSTTDFIEAYQKIREQENENELSL